MNISEREIWACAHEVIRQHGEAARFHALRRTDALIAKSDVAGQRTWMRILRCIEELENRIPPSEQLN